MSTIAITETGIAYDNLVVWDDQKDLSAVPKVFLTPHEVICVTGEIGPARFLAHRYLNGQHPRDVIKDMSEATDFEFVVATEEDYKARRVTAYTVHNPYGDIVKIPYFMGSGAAYARGALLAGAAASAAVGVAAICDVNTGGGVLFTPWEKLWEVMREMKEGFALTDVNGNRIPEPR